jgi:ryanodine receptor 2
LTTVIAELSYFYNHSISGTTQKGLTEIDVAEGVKIQLCNILEHICDIQLRHRIESLISFAEGFVSELQQDQCRR